MPFPQTLRDHSLPRRSRTKYLVDELSLRMENLLASGFRNPQLLTHRPQQRQSHIVEISDDEDPPTPPRNLQHRSDLEPRRVTMQGQNGKVLHVISESDSDEDLPLAVRQTLPDHRHKRPKLRHSPPVQVRAAGQSVKDRASTPQNGLRRRLFVDEPPPSATRPPTSQPRTGNPQMSSTSKTTPIMQSGTELDPKFPPYYYDTKFDIVMYRGPGFERFPVVLGTVKGHQEICDKWMGKGKPISSTVSEQSNGHSSPADEDETRCMHQILELFPDIQLDFLLQKIRDASLAINLIPEQLGEDALATSIISQILELDAYPKASSAPAGPSLKVTPIDETGSNVLYNKAQLKNGPYLKEAVILLAQQFTHIPTHVIYKVVHQKRSIFDSYVHLQQAEIDYYSKPQRPYIRSRQPRANLEKKYSRVPNEQRDEESYKNIVNELQAAKQHLAREEIKTHQKEENDEAEATNLAIHKAAGSLIECQCCFDDEIPMNRAVGCEADGDLHFFCYGCVASLAESQVGMMRYEMVCMDSSGCKASLSMETVAQAISIKTFDRLAFNQQQAEIAAAGIEGLEQCPHCDFKAICEPVEQDCVFNCQNPDCGRASCRRCNLDAHVPRTCEEVKSDKRLDARHQIEEARSDSVMRKCPKCGVRIVKEYGCNKVVCTSCRCIMCYICKADISAGKGGGYEHFNQPGAKCKLYEAQGVDQHELEADQAEREAIAKAKAEDDDIDETQLQIETGPGRKKAPRPAVVPPHAGLGVQFGHLQPPRGGLGLNHLANAAAHPMHVEHQLNEMRRALHFQRQQVLQDQQAMRRQAEEQLRMAQEQAYHQQLAGLRHRQQVAGGAGTNGNIQIHDPRAQVHAAQPAQHRGLHDHIAEAQMRLNNTRANVRAAEAQMGGGQAGRLGGRAAQPPRPQINQLGPDIGHQWFGMNPADPLHFQLGEPVAPAGGLDYDFNMFHEPGVPHDAYGGLEGLGNFDFEEGFPSRFLAGSCTTAE